LCRMSVTPKKQVKGESDKLKKGTQFEGMTLGVSQRAFPSKEIWGRPREGKSRGKRSEKRSRRSREYRLVARS